MKIAFIGKRRQSPRDVVLLNNFMSILAERGAEISVESRLVNTMLEFGPLAVSHIEEFQADDFEADMVISIGGDGTLLRSASAVALKEIPVLGINTGHLGFLADESLDRVSELAEMLLACRFEIENRTMLDVELCGHIPHGLEPDHHFALNEVAVLRQDTASMITVDTSLDGMDVASYQGDGLIISTPTGSTAYNLSVGGPIIEPAAPAFVISPIAPHSLTMRPLVVSNHRIIRLAVYSRSSSYRLTLDGRAVILPLETELIVRRAPASVRIIHFPGHNFFDTLRSKMLWGVSKR